MKTKIAIITVKGKKVGSEGVGDPEESARNTSIRIRNTTAKKAKNPPITTR